MTALLGEAQPGLEYLYGQWGGITGRRTAISIFDNGRFEIAHDPNPTGAPVRGTLTAGQMRQLRALAEAMPDYSAPRSDHFGSDIRAFVTSAVKLNKSARWTDLSPDEPQRAVALSRAIESAVTGHAEPILVKSASLSIEKKQPPNLLIRAVGETRTGGWLNERLVPHVYVMPPPDGMWGFDLVAVDPGHGPDVITEVTATHRWEGFPADRVKGVRIYGSGNSVAEARL